METEHVDRLGIVGARRDDGLGDDLGRGGHDVGISADGPERFLPVVHPEPCTIGQDPQVGARDEDALPQVIAQAVHDAQHDDQRHYSHYDPADGDDGVERGEPAGAAALQVANGDAALEPGGPAERRGIVSAHGLTLPAAWRGIGLRRGSSAGPSAA